MDGWCVGLFSILHQFYAYLSTVVGIPSSHPSIRRPTSLFLLLCFLTFIQFIQPNTHTYYTLSSLPRPQDFNICTYCAAKQKISSQNFCYLISVVTLPLLYFPLIVFIQPNFSYIRGALGRQRQGYLLVNKE